MIARSLEIAERLAGEETKRGPSAFNAARTLPGTGPMPLAKAPPANRSISPTASTTFLRLIEIIQPAVADRHRPSACETLVGSGREGPARDDREVQIKAVER